MARPIQVSWPAPVTTAVTTAQTRTGAGVLVIDGTLLNLPLTMVGTYQANLGIGTERTVSLTSTGNLSAVNITITGRLRGVVVTETRAGPNNNTVETTQLFGVVTSVTTSATLGTAMSVGTGTTGNTLWVTNNMHVAPVNLTVVVGGISGTLSVTVQDTPDDIQTVAEASLTKFSHPVLTAVTANAESNYVLPPRFVRALVNSSTDGAFTFTVIQAGIN